MSSLETKDVVTIAITSISATIALVGALWQFALYKLSGARVFVEIRHAMVDLYGNTGISEVGRRLPNGEMERFKDNFPKALVYLRVVNIGRTATSIDDLAIDGHSRRNRWKIRWLRRHRSTYRGLTVPIKDSTTGRYFRLEPGQSAFVYFDAQGMFSNAMAGERPSKLVLRASATPAGRRAKRSKWSNRIVVRQPADLGDWFEGADRDSRVYRELWQGMISSGVPLDEITTIWFDVKNALDSGVDKEAIVDIVAPGEHPEFRRTLTALKVYRLYHAAVPDADSK